MDADWTETEGEKYVWMIKKHTERVVHTAVTNLISCRLREGYTVKDVIIKST